MAAGPNFPSSSSSTGTGQAWANLGNLGATDQQYATCSPSNNGIACQFINATGFGFNLPSSAIVTGVVVSIVRHISSGSNTGDTQVKLIKGGSVVGTNKGTNTTYGTTDATATYGASNDLWGITLLYSDVNASNFGIQFNPTTPVNNGASVFVDSITITVYYYDTASNGTNPQTVTDVAPGGDAAWTNPSNAKTTDGSYAVSGSISSKATTTTDNLEATNFGFNIPSNAIINGIQLAIVRHQAGGGGVIDNVVSLIKGGTISGNNKASATTYPTSDGTATYGGGGDLWGLTLAPADINASNFGAVLQTTNTNSTSSTASVDSFTMTVYYQTSAGIAVVSNVVAKLWLGNWN